MNITQALEILGLESYTDDVKQVRKQAARLLQKCHVDVGGSDEQTRLVIEARNYLIYIIESGVDDEIVPVVKEVALDFLNRFLQAQPDIHHTRGMRSYAGLDDFGQIYHGMETDYTNRIVDLRKQRSVGQQVAKHIRSLSLIVKAPPLFTDHWEEQLMEVSLSVKVVEQEIETTNLKLKALQLISRNDITLM